MRRTQTATGAGRGIRSRTGPLLAAAITMAAAGCASPPSRHHGETLPPPRQTTTTTTAAGASPSPTTPPPVAGGASSQWTTYQAGNSRLGEAGPQPSLDPIRAAWRNPLDGGAVYAQVLVARGKVLVATEHDDVYALDPGTGRTLWEVHLGAPLQNVTRFAGCGDIDPLGITSTPVVDPSNGVLYVVAEVATGPGGSPPVHHELVGVKIATGRTVMSVDVSPPLPAGETPVSLLQRAALAYGNGRVYVGFGGQFGDCGAYHGWVVAVPVSTSGPPAGPDTAFDVTPSSSGGAVWDSGGGPSIDGAGNVYISTGNPNSGGPSPWAEAVVKLSPGLGTPPEASFQDPLATDDLDLATGDVVLLPGGQLFVVGKTQVGYLLSQASLSRVAPISGRVCGSDPDGGAAYDPATASVYVPCRGGGINQIRLSGDQVGWHAGEVNSGPIVVNGQLWALAYPAGTLQELEPATGRVLQSVAVGTGVPNFASPSAALGLLLVGTDHGVVAFAGPAGAPSG